jgi:glycosyl transferase family 87
LPVSNTAMLNRDSAALTATAGGALSVRAQIAMRVLGWLAAFVLALWLMLAWGNGTGVHNDFTQNVWLPSRLLLDGADPYNATHAQVDEALGVHASAFEGFNSGADYHFIYPTWVALAFTPFALLPLVASLAIWRALNLLLLVWAVVHLLRVSNPSFRSGRVAAVTAITLTVFLSLLYRESILTLFVGQFSIIEFGILAAIWGGLVDEGRRTKDEGKLTERTAAQFAIRHALMGIGLAILATKPQAVGLPVLLLVLWAISRRRWAIPAWCAASMSFLLFVPLIAYPSSLSEWLRIVLGGQAESQVLVSASVWGVSNQWLGDNLPWVAVALVLSFVGVVALLPHWRRDLLDRVSPVPMSLALTIVINSVISPYMLGYEHVLLLFPAMLMLAAAGLPDEQAGSGWKLWRIAIYGWMAALPFIIVAVQVGLDSKEYPVVVQSVTMLALLYAARLRWRVVRGT